MIRALLVTAACAPLLAACGAVRPSSEAQIVEVEQLTRKGDYGAAAELSADVLETLSERDPLRPRAEAAQRNVSLASGLDTARTLTLADRDDEALTLLDELAERFPDSRYVAAWQGRTRRKLATKWFEVAREALANERFEAARAAYRKAIEYDPEHPVAPAGLRRLGVVEAYRADLADGYYYDGVRALTDDRLSESVSGFEKSKKYDEDDPRTKLRITQVDRERAKARVEYAETLVADRRYAAARAEYAEAARLDPASAEIADGLARMAVEAEVSAAIDEAESALLRGEFDKGEALLREAAERTELQADLVAEALEGIDDTRVGKRYQRALDLEHDFRYEDAIGVYASILETRDYYKDVRARLDTLRRYVSEAERLYGEAEMAQDDETKLELLRQIEVFWPEYRDVPERIRELQGA